MGETESRQPSSDSVKQQAHDALAALPRYSFPPPGRPAGPASVAQLTATLASTPRRPPRSQNNKPETSYYPEPPRNTKPQHHQVQEQRESHPHGGPPNQRRPLPGSPRQSMTPGFGGKLPPISSLLPPASHYPQIHPQYPSAETARPPTNPLEPPPPATTASHPPTHRPLPLMPPHLPYGQPSVLPSVPPLPSTTGPYRDLPPTEYAMARETLPLHRPFKCDICSQCFSRNHDLKRHRRVHVAAKPFQCPRCDKFFSRKDALKVWLCFLALAKRCRTLTCDSWLLFSDTVWSRLALATSPRARVPLRSHLSPRGGGIGGKNRIRSWTLSSSM